MQEAGSPRKARIRTGGTMGCRVEGLEVAKRVTVTGKQEKVQRGPRLRWALECIFQKKSEPICY